MFSRHSPLAWAFARAALLVVCALVFALSASPARAQTSTTTNALADALDAPALDFASSGSGAWFSQKKTTSDGIDAVQSGITPASGKSTLTVTVTGVTKFSFKWRVSSESNRDILTFYIDDVAQSSPISGNAGWQTRTYTLSGTGSHTLRWEYAKDSSVSSGSDAGWVDQFTILESAVPIITTQPTDVSVRAGDNAALSVQAFSTGTLSYQWYQGESGVVTTPIAGATGPFLLTPPLTATTRYWVKITKDTQSVSSRTAVVTVSALSPYSLLATGASAEGALGLGDVDETSTPTRAAIATVRVAAGTRHSLFLKNGGALWGMGDNSDSQLGVAGAEPHTSPVRILETGVAHIAAGGVHSLFLKSDGTLWGMGSNSDGQLGQPLTTTEITTPIQIATNVAHIAAGAAHSLFVKTDGTLWAMGAHGGASPGPTPVQLAEQVVFAAAGETHSLFIKSNGGLWAWGANDSGQLGDGSTENRTSPVLVAARVVTASAGAKHSLFISSDAFLLAMGSHAEGQLGAGSLVSGFSAQPRQIAANVTRATAGARHSLFLKADGSLWAMGDNSDGQLGDGTDVSRPTPVQIAAGVAGAAAGDTHTLILRTPVLYTVEFKIGAGATRTGGGALKQSVREGEAAVAPVVSGPSGKALHEWSADFSNVTGPLIVQAVYRSAQKIIFKPAPARTFEPPSDSLDLEVSSDSGLPVVLTVVSGPGYTAGTVLPAKALVYESGGQFVIRATAAAGENDKGIFAAATPVERTIEIKKLPQTLKFEPMPPGSATYGDAPITLSATSSIPNLPVTFKVVSGPATVSGNQLTFTGAGIVNLQAVQEGSGTYATTTLPHKITVGKKELTVSGENLTRAVGQPNPVFVLNYSGFVNGDTLTKEGVITAQPVLVSPATASTPPDDDGHTVVLQGGSAPNYTFVLADPAPKLFIIGYGGSYEALIDGEAHDLVPAGKLEITVAARGLQYTGTLRLAAESEPVKLRGALTPATDFADATHTFLRADANGVPGLELSFTVTTAGELRGTFKRGDADLISFADGVLLAPPGDAKTAGFGAHTLVLGPGIDAADTVRVPGHGHATAAVAPKTAVLKLNGKLADGAPLTASLTPAANRSYRLWATPYKKRVDSFLAGHLALEAHPETARFPGRFYIPADASAVLFWQKAALPTSTPPAKRDATYRAGIVPVTCSIRLDPWLPPLAAKRNQTAVTLAQRLDLADDNTTGATLEVVHGEEDLDLGALADALPTSLTLDAKGRITIAAPITRPPNRAAWKIAKFNAATGAFTGRFVLRDPPSSGTRGIVRTVEFSGTFRQRPAGESDSPVAEGFFLLPALDDSAEKSSHVFGLLPDSEYSERARI